MTIKLGVPSKGRLMEKTFDWFAARGITLARAGSDREYAGRVEGIDNVELVLLSAGEIPRELAAGRIQLGVTGTDLIQEKLGAWETRVAALAGLGFGQADLVLAVPAAWVDVCTLDDLDAAAAWPTTSSSTARAQPKAPSRTRPPRPSPTSPRPATRCAPTTSRSWMTG